MSSMLNAGSLNFPQMALEAVTVVQNQQIKAAVAVVQSLQLANLALSGIGIGISVAGTAILAKRIARIEDRVSAVLPGLAAISRQLEAVRIDTINQDFTRLRTITDQVDEAWLPSASQGEWVAIARDSHFLADSFENRARELDKVDDPIVAEPFIDAFALASAIRVTSRLAAGQDDMARQAAASRAETLVRLGQRFQFGSLALRSASRETAGTQAWRATLDQAADDAQEVVGRFRNREIAAAATVETLQELALRGLSGREWLRESRSEDQAPLLFLGTTRAGDPPH